MAERKLKSVFVGEFSDLRFEAKLLELPALYVGR